MLPFGKFASIQSAHLVMAETQRAPSPIESRVFRIAYAPARLMSWSALVPSQPVVAGHSSIHEPVAVWMPMSQLPSLTAASAYFASWPYLKARASGYTASAAREWMGLGSGLVLGLTSAPSLGSPARAICVDSSRSSSW